ncbi:hypothetical protein PORCRE_783 [Porphyromonas crevioricanis JCM 15906]|uniref:Uncharacterized protein n=1 Tax=Porphyromonas crevioricanis JCM 15906 TaxID=1305617 RepID=T1DR45_9PORP|nr:hypothetical protein PORCRE_783 [Porphyromonas crevioricanis JCM 15906]GAD07321.1 hypothetical protein PORCAN_941 [Porphyromonas crevioricanis JCM 13913]
MWMRAFLYPLALAALFSIFELAHNGKYTPCVLHLNAFKINAFHRANKRQDLIAI